MIKVKLKYKVAAMYCQRVYFYGEISSNLFDALCTIKKINNNQ